MTGGAGGGDNGDDNGAGSLDGRLVYMPAPCFNTGKIGIPESDLLVDVSAVNVMLVRTPVFGVSTDGVNGPLASFGSLELSDDEGREKSPVSPIALQVCRPRPKPWSFG